MQEDEPPSQSKPRQQEPPTKMPLLGSKRKKKRNLQDQIISFRTSLIDSRHAPAATQDDDDDSSMSSMSTLSSFGSCTSASSCASFEEDLMLDEAPVRVAHKSFHPQEKPRRKPRILRVQSNDPVPSTNRSSFCGRSSLRSSFSSHQSRWSTSLVSSSKSPSHGRLPSTAPTEQ